jgi:hypothetical protein
MSCSSGHDSPPPVVVAPIAPFATSAAAGADVTAIKPSAINFKRM